MSGKIDQAQPSGPSDPTAKRYPGGAFSGRWPAPAAVLVFAVRRQHRGSDERRLRALRMLDDLELDEKVYGLGAGMFYVGYMLFEVPSNLILNRVGARGGSAASWSAGGLSPHV